LPGKKEIKNEKKKSKKGKVKVDTPKKENKDITLKQIDLKVKQGEFICVIGDVASGKSSLLQAILGDMMLVQDDDLSEFKKVKEDAQKLAELRGKILDR